MVTFLRQSWRQHSSAIIRPSEAVQSSFRGQSNKQLFSNNEHCFAYLTYWAFVIYLKGEEPNVSYLNSLSSMWRRHAKPGKMTYAATLRKPGIRESPEFKLKLILADYRRAYWPYQPPLVPFRLNLAFKIFSFYLKFCRQGDEVL